MQSMTGYGRSENVSKQFHVDVSVKSVNGRFLEARVHMSKRYHSIEQEIIKICKSVFARGTVEVHIYVKPLEAQQTKLNVEATKHWLKNVRQALKALGVEDTLNAQDILNSPYFLASQDETEASESEVALILKTIRQAVKKCEVERVREGRALNSVCLNQIRELEKLQKKLFLLRDKFRSDAHGRFQEKLKKTLSSSQLVLDEGRVVQEVAMILERTDVEEELTRLLEHVRNVEKLLKTQGSVGKKLDFYAQELLREVNTIGSKSQYATITETVVSLKSMIEQFREQVQNIE